MDWIALLRKLGILRRGAESGTYTSGKEMPAEFLMDGVYDAEKDLVRREDFRSSGGTDPKKRSA